MPHGFFTIEHWTRKRWRAVASFDAGHSVSDVLAALEQRDRPGFFRIVQTQRMIWAERLPDGNLRLRKWHAGSPKTLARSAAAFDRDRGKWPLRKKS